VIFKNNALIGRGRYGFGAPGADGTGVSGAEYIDPRELESSFDLVLLAIGAREPRDIKVPGREHTGIIQALDYLSMQNRFLGKESGLESITAYGKRVVVLGGGDTGSDCVGTANRQGASKYPDRGTAPAPGTPRSRRTLAPLAQGTQNLQFPP
jgi:glutamate synthase (NADPH/NADH) small chain